MRTVRFIVAVLMAFVAVGCSSGVLYDEWQHVDVRGWEAEESQVFNCHVEDTSQTYLCCIEIRNTEAYPYSNIYLNIKTIYPDGEIAVDTNLQFVLADPDGRWRGRKSGKYIDGRYPFCFFRFPECGDYQFVIGHAMRDSSLVGVREIGMWIGKE